MTIRKCLLLCLAGLLLWAATSALAQSPPEPVRAVRDCDGIVTVDWSAVPGASGYRVFYRGPGDANERSGGSTGETSLSLGNLKPGTYDIYVDHDQGSGFANINLGMAYCPSHTLPPQYHCAEMTDRLVVSGIGKGTNCQSVIPGGIGDPSLIAAGVLDAIDIWGRASKVRFCFLKHGRLKFVDTATSPRVISDLAAEIVDGMTCGSVDRTGMVVLLRASETSGDADAASDEASLAPDTAETGPTSSTICQLTATGYLSLRGGPSVYYARIDTMPHGTRLIGMARAGDWFLVDYEGQRGWASGTYLAASPGCDAIGGSTRVFLPLATEPVALEAEAQEETGESAQTEMTMPGARPLSYCSLRAGDIINLRQGPGLEYGVIAEIPYQTILIATERTRDWFKVEYNGEIGWVNIDYVFRHGCG
ncbi:MAG: SH3 domain-containing protein [Chloroflexi bacterium]|nr:SH3 domain-containing protein [Chloroflexota bacterium]